MKRKKLVAGNWKMNLEESEAIKLANEVKAARGEFSCDVALIPSFLFITDVKHIIYASGIHLGAQNCSIFEIMPVLKLPSKNKIKYIYNF